MRGELGDPEGRQIETVTVAGDPATALADYAMLTGADLVVTGMPGRGYLDRLLLGSVAETLLERAPCSALCVPGSALARAAHRRRAGRSRYVGWRPVLDGIRDLALVWRHLRVVEPRRAAAALRREGAPVLPPVFPP